MILFLIENIISRKVLPSKHSPDTATFIGTQMAPLHSMGKSIELEVSSCGAVDIRPAYRKCSKCNGPCAQTFEFTSSFFREYNFLEDQPFCSSCGVSVDYLQAVFNKIKEFKGIHNLHVDYSCMLLEACIDGQSFDLKSCRFPPSKNADRERKKLAESLGFAFRLEQVVNNNSTKQNILVPRHLLVYKKVCEYKMKIKLLEDKLETLKSPDGDCVVVDIPRMREVIRQMYAGSVNNNSWSPSDAFNSQLPCNEFTSLLVRLLKPKSFSDVVSIKLFQENLALTAVRCAELGRDTTGKQDSFDALVRNFAMRMKGIVSKSLLAQSNGSHVAPFIKLGSDLVTLPIKIGMGARNLRGEAESYPNYRVRHRGYRGKFRKFRLLNIMGFNGPVVVFGLDNQQDNISRWGINIWRSISFSFDINTAITFLPLQVCKFSGEAIRTKIFGMCVNMGEIEDQIGGLLEKIENELDPAKEAKVEKKKADLEKKLASLEGDYEKDLIEFEKLELENLRGKHIPGPWDDVENAEGIEKKCRAVFQNTKENIKEHRNKGANLVLDYLEKYIVGRDISKIPEKEKLDLEELFRKQYPCKVESFDKSKKPVLYEVLTGSNPSDQQEMFQASYHFFVE